MSLIPLVAGIVPLLLQPYAGLVLIMLALPFLVGVGETVGWSEVVFLGLCVGWIVGWGLRTLWGRRSLTRLPRAVVFSAFLVTLLIVFSAALGLVGGAPMFDVLRDLSQFLGYLVIIPMSIAVDSRRRALRLVAVLALVGIPCYLWNTGYWLAVKHRLAWGGWPTLAVGASYIGPFIGALWPLALLRSRRWMQALGVSGVLVLAVLAGTSGYRHRVLQVVAIASLGSLVVWVAERRRRARLAARALGIAGVVGAVLIAGVLGVVKIPFVGDPSRFYASLIEPYRLGRDLSLQGRLLEAEAALDVFMTRPLFGVGLGHRVEMRWEHGRWYETALTQHIWIGEMLMKFGILGSVFFMWLFFSALRCAVATAGRVMSPMEKGLALGVAVWLLVWLVPLLGHFGDRGFSFALAVMLSVLPFLGKPHAERSRLSGSREGGEVHDESPLGAV